MRDCFEMKRGAGSEELKTESRSIYKHLAAHSVTVSPGNELDELEQQQRLHTNEGIRPD